MAITIIASVLLLWLVLGGIVAILVCRLLKLGKRGIPAERASLETSSEAKVTSATSAHSAS
jgi:hypothetical protein